MDLFTLTFYLFLQCLGYKYSFPFLAPECEITVAEGKFVKPLYKQIININHPTMGFIGLPFRSFLFPLFYYQVRFFLKTLTQEVKLPSKETMFTEFETFIHQKQEQGVPLRKYHEIKNELKFYMEDLAASANLEYLPPVVYNIYDATFNLRRNHLPIYRNAVFHIINESKFKITGLEILEKEEEDFAHHLQTET